MKLYTTLLTMLGLVTALNANSPYDDPKTWPLMPAVNAVEKGHIDEALKALERHDKNAFDQHFKELIGYNLQDIHTQKPSINSMQVLIVLNLYRQAQKQLDSISWANNHDNVMKAMDLYEWLSVWASLNKELKEKYAFREEVVYRTQTN